jgi:hypothetical protein
MAWFDSFWIDFKLGNFSPEERRGFLRSVNYKRKKRRRPVNKTTFSRIKRERKETDSINFKKICLSSEK